MHRYFHCCFAITLMCCVPLSQAFAEPQHYFGGIETFSSDTQNFPKWNGLMSRANAERVKSLSQCGTQKHFPCSLREWKGFINENKGLPLADLMRRVNAYANQFPYTPDQINWMVEDYWETPGEFHSVSGDCEDYAATKYFSLRAAGIPADYLRIIIVQDFNLGGTVHAVLGVKEGGQWWLLDNQIKHVVPATSVYHYKPIYGINEQGWWAYHPKV